MSSATALEDDPQPVGDYAVRTGRSAGTRQGNGRSVPEAQAGAQPGAQLGTDELLDVEGGVRPASRELAASIDRLGPAGLLARRDQALRLAEDDGVTYGPSDATHPAHTWAVDPLPVVLDSSEWATLAPGLIQRAKVLDLLLADLYGPRVVLREGIVPPEVVLAHGDFLRAGDGIRLPGAHQLFLSATDLARDQDGRWTVMADRTQAPSGAGYAMENRRIVSRVMPGLHRDTRLARLRDFFHTVRSSLQEIAPTTAEAPRVVLLTPGSGSETAFDQAFMATLLGYPMVTGEDLSVRDGRVWMRGLGRPEPVDVILRRVDAAYADPLELRPESRLGVPGLLEAARRGQVSIVNPVGSGVLENPGLLPFLPEIARRLLGEPLILATVATYWCGDPASRSHVLTRLHELVIRPLTRSPGVVSRLGAELSQSEREQLRAQIEAEPHAWCAQEPLPLSTAPLVTDAGLEPRRLVVRTFAVAQGEGYQLMAGGLARVAGSGAGALVTNALGAVAKDVWVVAGESGPPGESGTGSGRAGTQAPLGPLSLALAPRAAEDLFWLGRYAERAEDTVRVLRVVDDLAEDWSRRPGSVGAQALQALLVGLRQVTGTQWTAGQGDAPNNPQPELIHLMLGATTPGTLAFAVRRTVDAAHAVREQLSLDTWLVLGSLDRVLEELSSRAGAAGPGQEPALRPTLARVLEGLLALAGLGAESMVRDGAHAFMDAGRRIERSLQLLGVLAATVPQVRAPAVDSMVLESVLVVGESIITHRRRAAAGLIDASPAGAVHGVLELLLRDKTNPRALAYQFERLAEDLRALPAADDARRQGPRDEISERLLGAVARLREADLPALSAPDENGNRAALDDLLRSLMGDVSALSTALEDAYFRPLGTLRPLPVSSGWWMR